MALPLSYNWRNLWVRRLSSGLTFVVVSAVVFVLTVLLSFVAGIRATLVTAGSPGNLIVLKPGATAESTSVILPEEANRLVTTPGLARDATGEPLLSRELCVQTAVRRPNGDAANVAVRGVDDTALLLRPDVRLIEGRWYAAGDLEVVVGRALRDRFPPLQIGAQVALGRSANRPYTVVGVFEAGGSALESEIWARRTLLADIYGRPFFSSVLMRLESKDAVSEAQAYVAGPGIELEARTESGYYEDLSAKTREIIALTSVIIGIMAIGAAFAVANTMFAAVDARRREIAMLRTIGFSRSAIVLAFVIESLIVCLLACVAGLLVSAAVLLIGGPRADFFSDATFTLLAFDQQITPGVVAVALLLALGVGLIGAAAPALRASRVPIIRALRRG